MKSFEYLAPQSVGEALRLLSREGARPVAGGTDLVIQIGAGEVAPVYLVDLACLDLRYVRVQGGVIRIGALSTMADLMAAEAIRQDLLCLAEAVARIGAVQCRTMATLGGNLCSAVPSADSAPPLLVLDARVSLASVDQEREVALEHFFTGPKQTALTTGEILTEVQVPIPPPGTGTSFLKLGRRKALTLAVVNTAALLTLDEDGRTVANVRLALGAVAPTPLRARQAEDALLGKEISKPLVDEVAAQAVDETAPVSDLRGSAAYRRQVTRVLVASALTTAWQRAIGENYLPKPWVEGSHDQPAAGEASGRTVTLSEGTLRSLAGEAWIEITVNEQVVRASITPRTLLVDVLREQLGLRGTKRGCGNGECGACTVLIDGKPVNACLYLAVRARNKTITTIEGLGTRAALDPLQEAFITHGAVQCGYCASGMLLSARALLNRTPYPTEREIRYAIAGNICRCTGYAKIVTAIKAAVQSENQGGMTG